MKPRRRPDEPRHTSNLTASSISRQFPTTNLPALNGGLSWQLDYLADRVVLRVVSPCVADVDDGLGSGTPDGGVTIDDFLCYLQIFEAGC